MTRPHRRIRATPARRTRYLGLLAAAVVAAGATMITPTPASADPITYTLSDVTATWQQGMDTLTGTFTFDPTGPTLDAVDITVAGTVDPGIIDVVQPYYVGTSNFDAGAGTTNNPEFNFSFSSPLGLGDDPDSLSGIGDLYPVGYGLAGAITGEADPLQATPAPVLGSGLSGLAVLAVFLLAGRAKLRFRQA